MYTILPLDSKIQKLLSKHSRTRQFQKQIHLLTANPSHPSLHVELLEPKTHGIYSFRIDRKYRALFIFRPDRNALEILTITVHYR